MSKSPIKVLYEDNHLIFVEKQAGVLIQGDKTGDTSLLELTKTYIKQTYKKPGEVYLAMVHRLDRPTSGVVLFCKTSKAAARISRDFQTKDIDKRYVALVEGHLAQPSGTLTHALLKDGNKNKSFVSKQPKAKQATLHYNTIETYDRYTLVEVELETGRHHQIRCQFAYMGHPLKGDLKYGAKRSNPNGSISLHAYSLTITHPTTKESLTVKSPYDFMRL